MSKSEAATTGPAVCHWDSSCSVDLCTHTRHTSARNAQARTRLMGTHGDGPCPQARHGALCAAGVSQRLVTGRAPVEEEASVALEALGERRGRRAAHCCFQERTRTLGRQFQQNLPAWRPGRGLTLHIQSQEMQFLDSLILIIIKCK